MIISVIAGIMKIASQEAVTGIFIIIVGVFASWISAFTLYGFGKLIETNENTMHMIKDIGTMIEELANDVYATSLQSDEDQSDRSENSVKENKPAVSSAGDLSRIIGKPKMKK